MRWGADDNGKAYEKGQEEDTWEPAEHVAHLEAYSAFLANSRKPLPTEALALNDAMRLQVAQLTTRTGTQWTMTCGMQGKSVRGEDWEENNISFSSGH